MENLESLKKDLHEAFHLAIQWGKRDYQDDNNPSHQAAAQSFIAAGAIAQALVAIDREQREARNVRPVLDKSS